MHITKNILKGPYFYIKTLVMLLILDLFIDKVLISIIFCLILVNFFLSGKE